MPFYGVAILLWLRGIPGFYRTVAAAKSWEFLDDFDVDPCQYITTSTALLAPQVVLTASMAEGGLFLLFTWLFLHLSWLRQHGQNDRL